MEVRPFISKWSRWPGLQRTRRPSKWLLRAKAQRHFWAIHRNVSVSHYNANGWGVKICSHSFSSVSMTSTEGIISERRAESWFPWGWHCVETHAGWKKVRIQIVHQTTDRKRLSPFKKSMMATLCELFCSIERLCRLSRYYSSPTALSSSLKASPSCDRAKPLRRPNCVLCSHSSISLHTMNRCGQRCMLGRHAALSYWINV